MHPLEVMWRLFAISRTRPIQAMNRRSGFADGFCTSLTPVTFFTPNLAYDPFYNQGYEAGVRAATRYLKVVGHDSLYLA